VSIKVYISSIRELDSKIPKLLQTLIGFSFQPPIKHPFLRVGRHGTRHGLDSFSQKNRPCRRPAILLWRGARMARDMAQK
jgi:hypothetical protein